MKTVHEMAIMTPGICMVKNSSILRGLMEHRFHPMLVEINQYIIDTYGEVITESWREPLHPGDVHATDPVRALDLRSWCYENMSVAQKIMDDVNKRWEYDPKRPGLYLVARIHKTKNGGLHFHIQTHDNTRRRP